MISQVPTSPCSDLKCQVMTKGLQAHRERDGPGQSVPDAVQAAGSPQAHVPAGVHAPSGRAASQAPVPLGRGGRQGAMGLMDSPQVDCLLVPCLTVGQLLQGGTSLKTCCSCGHCRPARVGLPTGRAACCRHLARPPSNGAPSSFTPVSWLAARPPDPCPGCFVPSQRACCVTQPAPQMSQSPCAERSRGTRAQGQADAPVAGPIDDGGDGLPAHPPHNLQQCSAESSNLVTRHMVVGSLAAVWQQRLSG